MMLRHERSLPVHKSDEELARRNSLSVLEYHFLNFQTKETPQRGQGGGDDTLRTRGVGTLQASSFGAILARGGGGMKGFGGAFPQDA